MTEKNNLEQKRLLLKALLEKKAGLAEQAVLASVAQQALWAFSLRYPQSPAYHLKFSAELHPGINKELLESTLNDLIGRHAALHSTFSMKEGNLYQCFDEKIRLHLIEKKIAQAQVESSILQDYAEPFELGKGPLIRGILYSIGKQKQVLLLVFHHLILDGLSLLYFISELGQTLQNKTEHRLPLNYNYRHYLQEQQQLPNTKEYAQSLQYWHKQLKALHFKINLPYDKFRQAAPSYEGAFIAKKIRGQKVQALKQLAAELNTTLHALMLGIYHLMLHGLSGQQLVLSLTPALGRERKEFFSVIGYFANMVLIKTKRDEHLSLKAFLKNCHHTLGEALRHQRIPYATLARSLQLQHSLSELPLAQVAFAFHQPLSSSQGLKLDLYDREANHLQWGTTQVKPFRIPPTACQFDLYLVALELSDGSMDLSFEYMQDVFSSDRVSSIAHYFMTLVDAVLLDKEQKLSALPLCPLIKDMEKELSHYNNTDKKMSEDTATALCFNALDRYAKNVAVIDSKGEYSYELLHHLSNGLALLLPQNNEGQAKPIAILLEKGVHQIVAVLATLWSGHYFVPIHLDTPTLRIKNIIDLAGIEQVISSSALKAMHHIDQINWIDVYQIKPAKKFIPVPVSPDNLIYTIFTSGTTGLPKGVAISHASLLNTVLAINELFGINEQDRLFAISDLSFDLAMYDVFGGLLAGAGLIMCAQEEVKEPKQWLKLINKHQVTVWNSVPMLLSMLLAQTKHSLSLEHVFLSGDWIAVELIDKAHKLCPIAEVVSLGGPTETTIWSIYYPLKRDTTYEFIPYGFPLPNQRYYVLNEELQPCPLGQTGAIYAAGKGLAQGYLHDTEKTAEAFIMHPQFGRIYHTGDLGALTAEFGIRIKGRSDRQVKIGGYRIELDEVRLAMEPCFSPYSVTCHALGSEHEKQLIGFIEVALEKDYSLISDIQKDFSKEYAQLVACLPLYMIPEIFVGIKAIPLNKNNKIDYQALPDLKALLGEKNDEILDPIEQKIAEIWAAALKVALHKIGPKSHFFHLGGDSLKAVSVINAVDTTFHISCSLNTLFEAPILQVFALRVDALERVKEEVLPLLQANKKDLHKPFPLTPVQQAYWIGRQNKMDLGGVGSHSYYEFDSPILEAQRFHKALDAVIGQHSMLRMIITQEGKQCILEKVPSYPLEVIETNLKEHSIRIRKQLTHELIPMNEFPSFRIKLLQFPEWSRVVLSYDALQFDAWSVLNFLRDLSWHYMHYPEQPSPHTLEFRDYVLYLEQLKATKAFHKAKNYWSARLPELPYGPQLPVKPVSGLPEFLRVSGFLPKKQWLILQKKAQFRACTPTCLVLTVFALVMRNYSLNANFCLNLTLFNRLPVHQDIEELIGDFTSLILFEVKSQEMALSFAQILHSMQEQLVLDLEHRLYDGVQVQRDLRSLYPHNKALIAPVVFTSTLGFTKPKMPLGEAKINYSITQTPQVWLDNQIREDEQGLHWVWDYLNDLFDPQTLEQMHEQFITFLQLLVQADWDTYQVPTVLAEAQQRIAAFNDTKAAYPQLTLTQALVQSCNKYQAHSAISDAQGKLSYQQLNEQAKALAQVLKHYPPQSSLAVFLEKGRDQVIACVAILLAGHHFAPLSLSNPRRRLLHLMQESQVVGVVTTLSLAQAYNIPDSSVIDVNSRGTGDFIDPQTRLEDTAYTIYTSGSTGTPKGVVISHLAVMNTLLAINERFKVCAQDKILALSDLSFDLAIYDVFGLLLAGGCIVFPLQDLVKEPKHWQELIQTQGITLWNSVPMLYAMLLHDSQPLSSLRCVLLSGDWIMPEIVAKGFALSPFAQIIALGGATECSIWSNSYLLKAEQPEPFIPYGYPLPNQHYYVLHQNGSLCPEGVEGELYIGGLGLAKAYFQDSKSTQKSFIMHAEWGRLYRTGDWGMLTHNKGIKFLGRKDNQVKIGGHRIELNEVEHSIRQCLAIEELILDVQEVNQSKKLIAYGVLASNAEKIQQKWANKNIRVFSDELPSIAISANIEAEPWFIRKSYRLWTKQKVDLKLIEQIIEQDQEIHHESEDFFHFLKPLTALNTPLSPLPKFLYPSAGGLYAVQCYLSLTTPRGCYYYSPLEAKLVQINSEPVSEINELFLIADSSLISPHYPADWKRFCEVEAGHMATLVNRYQPLKASYQAFNRTAFQLTEQHVLMAQFQIGVDFDYAPIRGGFSLFENSDQIKSAGINQNIISSAGAIIIFNSDFAPFAIGWHAQTWMENLALARVGSCYIGTLEVAKEKQLGIALGAVNAQMLASQQISKNEPSSQELISQAYAKLQTQLPEYMIPSDFVMLSELPLSANGKLDKSKLPKKTYKSFAKVKLEDGLEMQVGSLWQRVLNLSCTLLYQDSDFFSLGGDSLSALEMLSLVKSSLDIQADLKIIFNHSTLKTFCEQLRFLQMNHLMESEQWVSLNESGSEKPLIVLVHPGTGTLDCYLGFAKHLEGHAHCVAIQYKESSASNLFELAAEYAEHLMKHYPHKDPHLMGYSLGAHIAFEMAKILDEHHFPYQSLTLVDALPIEEPREIFYETDDEMNLFAQVLVEDFGVAPDKLHLFLNYIQDRQNALLSLCNQYQTQGKIIRPLLYYKAQDPTPYLKEKFIGNKKTSWSDYCSKLVLEQKVDGNHMTIFSQKHVATLSRYYMDFLLEDKSM